jgi:hypothetical protein
MTVSPAPPDLDVDSLERRVTYSCFVSYGRSDAAFARRLSEALEDNGVRCWFDEKQLLPGDDIYEQVDRGMRIWDKILLCCSRSSLSSWWLRDAVSAALAKEDALARRRGRPAEILVPLDLDGYLLKSEDRDSYVSALRRRTAVDFVGWDRDEARFASQVSEVVRGLRNTEGARKRPKAVIVGNDLQLVTDLKHLLHQLDFPEPVLVASQPSQGRTILEQIEYYAEPGGIVFFVLDETGGSESGPRARARQNVALEMGYFLGRFALNSGRLVVLYKGDLEIPSDLPGVTYIDVGRGVASVSAVIRREFAALG